MTTSPHRPQQRSSRHRQPFATDWRGRLCEAPPQEVVRHMAGDSMCQHSFLTAPRSEEEARILPTMVVGFKWVRDGHARWVRDGGDDDVCVCLSPQRLEQTCLHVNLEVPPHWETAMRAESVALDQVWKSFYRLTARRIWDGLLKEGWVRVESPTPPK